MGCIASATAETSAQPAPEEPQVAARPVWKELELNGNKKALLVGINYIAQKGELRGCCNDVIKIKEYLLDQGFREGDDNMMILTEQEDGPDWPTKDRLIEGLQWLVEGAAAGDNLFFHYSGHGTFVKDTSRSDGEFFDEALVPLDYQTAGFLIDDDINLLICKPLPEGVRLTIIMDCCHSGSPCDLPFSFVATKENTLDWQEKTPEMMLSKTWRELLTIDGLQKAYATFMAGGLSEPEDLGSRKVTDNLTRASVVMFSGWRDREVSEVSDASSFELHDDCGPGGVGGACTNAFLQVIHSQPHVCFIQLLEEMRKLLQDKKFNQVPMLSSSKIIELGSPFCLNA